MLHFNASAMRIKSMRLTSAYTCDGRDTFIVAVYTCHRRISIVCHASMILQCGPKSWCAWLVFYGIPLATYEYKPGATVRALSRRCFAGGGAPGVCGRRRRRADCLWSAAAAPLKTRRRRRRFCGVTWQEMLMLVMLCYVTVLVSYWRGQHEANRCFIRNTAVLSLNVIASIKIQQSPVSKLQSHRSKVEQFQAQYCENRSITLSHFNLHNASANTRLFSWTNTIVSTTCGDS